MPIKVGTGISHNTIEFTTPATDVYRIIFFCPTLGHSEQGSRYSGIYCQSVSSPSSAITATLLTTNSLSWNTAYGGDIVTFAQDGFVWAARADISMIGPKATQAGVAYTGRLRYNQFQGAGLTLTQLMKIADPIDLSLDSNREFTLIQSVSNTNIIFSDDNGDKEYMSEAVPFLIIKQPYQSIDTGAYLAWNMIMRLDFNYTFWTDATNAVAHGLMRNPALEESVQLNDGSHQSFFSQLPAAMSTTSQKQSGWSKLLDTTINIFNKGKEIYHSFQNNKTVQHLEESFFGDASFFSELSSIAPLLLVDPEPIKAMPYSSADDLFYLLQARRLLKYMQQDSPVNQELVAAN